MTTNGTTPCPDDARLRPATEDWPSGSDDPITLIPSTPPPRRVGALCDVLGGRYDPMQHLGLVDPFRGVTLTFQDLPDGMLGLTDFEGRRITLARNMSGAELRSTLSHELVHLERGRNVDAPEAQHLEEAIVELVTASRLVPLAELVDLRRRIDTAGPETAADQLGLDDMTLRAAVILLDAAERLAEGGAPRLRESRG